jgi:putative ABC transport system permease protein
MVGVMKGHNILAADVHQSARRLAKAPGFTLVALLVIALGLSATTTVFSLIDAVLLRSLPYGEPDRLVYMWAPIDEFKALDQESPPPYADLMDWRKMSHSFTYITGLQQRIALLGDGNPERVGCAAVLGNFFQTLKAAPQLGRAIDADDDRPGQPRVAVISDALWRTRFAGNPDAVGKTIRMDSQDYRVIGVMPKDFGYPHGADFPTPQFAALKRTDVWIPAALNPRQVLSRPDPTPDVAIGRMRAGVTFEQAQSEMSAIEKRLAPLYPPLFRDVQARLVPFIESPVGSVRPLLRLILGAVLLVLLMVSVNFANLLLSRVAGRVHEIGVRTALGAQRARLVRLMLTESLMLSLAGGALGALMSFAALKMVARLNPGDIPRFEEATIDSRVLLFGLVIALATGFVSGIFPALSGSSVNVSELLRQGGRGIAGSRWRARNALIVAEVALAVVLLAGAGLLIRSYLMVQGEDKGFAPSTLTMTLNVDPRARKPEQVDAFRRRVMDRIRTLPGVEAAGSIDDLPLSRSEDSLLIEVEGRGKWEAANVRETAGEYFRAMQIPLIAGRFLNDADIPVPCVAPPKSVIVTASLARAYLGGRDRGVGRRLRFDSAWSTVVGVVGDVRGDFRDGSLEKAPQPTVYWQCGLADSVAIRTAGPPAAIISSVRRIVSGVDRGSTLTDIRTMKSYIYDAGARRRFQTVVLAAFSGIAVFLALAGLYGLLSYTVTQRRAEIGVRMALGASRSAVVWMVVRYGVTLAGCGLAMGLALASGLTRVMASLLYRVRAADPITFIAVPLFILFVAVVACLVPAWRAARTDPVSALRHH